MLLCTFPIPNRQQFIYTIIQQLIYNNKRKIKTPAFPSHLTWEEGKRDGNVNSYDYYSIYMFLIYHNCDAIQSRFSLFVFEKQQLDPNYLHTHFPILIPTK